jgi:heme-degrading monooxygenase HmoA
MSVVKINAITVPPERSDELAARFAARAGEVGKADGFEEFQLLRPTDDRSTWLVYTRWRDEASFRSWVDSPAFGRGHRGGEGQGEAVGGRRGPRAGVTRGRSRRAASCGPSTLSSGKPPARAETRSWSPPPSSPSTPGGRGW